MFYLIVSGEIRKDLFEQLQMDTGNSCHHSSHSELEMTIITVYSLFVSHNNLENGDELVSPITVLLQSRAENSYHVMYDRFWCLCETVVGMNESVYLSSMPKHNVTLFIRIRFSRAVKLGKCSLSFKLMIT